MLSAAAQAQLHAQAHQLLEQAVIMALFASDNDLALPCDDDPCAVLPCNEDTDVVLPNDDDPGEIIVHTQTLKRSTMTSGTVKKKPSVKKNSGTVKKKPSVTKNSGTVKKKRASGGPGHREFVLGLPSNRMEFPTGLGPPKPPCDCHHFWEIYSPPRVAPLVSNHGKTAPRSLDLKTGWDLTNPEQLLNMQKDINLNRPCCVLVCPPCTALCGLMTSNWTRMTKASREQKCTTGIYHLDVAVSLMKFQVDHNSFYIFEHPVGSLCWQRENLKDVPGEEVVFHQCMVGLKAPGPDGLPMKKPTKIKTNVPNLVNALRSLRCKGHHKHQTMQGSLHGVRLSAYAAEYPSELAELFATYVCKLP